MRKISISATYSNSKPCSFYSLWVFLNNSNSNFRTMFFKERRQIIMHLFCKWNCFYLA